MDGVTRQIASYWLDATRVSSTRGGNLFFISNPEEVQTVFHEQLDTMVSELAHDVRITMMPRDGYRISGVFGVPDGLMTDAGDGAVTITVAGADQAAVPQTWDGPSRAAAGARSVSRQLVPAGMSETVLEPPDARVSEPARAPQV